MPDKDMLLLDPATGKPVCRKEVSTLVDQSSIIGNSDAATPFRVNYPVVAGALAGSGVAASAGKLNAAIVHASGSASSGAGTTASPLNVPAAQVVPVATDSVQGKVELTGSAQMPAEKTRDDSALTPAGAAKLLKYIKPVASSGALNAAQLSAEAIELPMFSNFSCTGGTNGAPKWTIHKEGGGTCDIDLGAYGGGGGGGVTPPHKPGDVVFTGTLSDCLPLDAGVYEAENAVGQSWVVVVLGGKISNALVPPSGGVGSLYSAVGAGSCVKWANNSGNEPELPNIAIRGISGTTFGPLGEITKITYLKAVGG